jgi:O-antigen/teichoic acid export membrane protein
VTSASQTQLPARAAPDGERSVHARFAFGALWSVFGAVASRGLTLAGFVLASRALGAAGFGEVGMVQSTQGLFGVLAGGGLGLAATKYVAEYRTADRSRAGRCFALALLVAVVSGGAGAAVLFAFAGPMAENVLGAPHLGAELRVATGLLLFGAIGGVQTGAINGLGEFRTAALLAIFRGACVLAALVAGVRLGGVLGAVLGLVAAEAAGVVANHLALRRLFPQAWDGGAGPAAWRELAVVARFAGMAVLGSIATTLALWLGNTLLVSRPGGYAALGVFNAAERWRQLLLFLPAAVSPIILSMLSHLHGSADRGAYRRLLGVNLCASAAVVLVPAAGLAALAPLAMGVFGEEYRSGATTLVILTASAVAMVFNTLLGQVLVSKGAIWWRTALDVLLAAVLVLVAWKAVPSARDEGLALAHLAAYGVTAVALVMPVMFYLRQQRNEAAPRRN